jgi:hypothetical protein
VSASLVERFGAGDLRGERRAGKLLAEARLQSGNFRACSPGFFTQREAVVDVEIIGRGGQGRLVLGVGYLLSSLGAQ